MAEAASFRRLSAEYPLTGFPVAVALSAISANWAAFLRYCARTRSTVVPNIAATTEGDGPRIALNGSVMGFIRCLRLSRPRPPFAVGGGTVTLRYQATGLPDL